MKKINLKIGGEYRDFYFGLGFLGNLLEKENIGINEIDEKLVNNPFKWMPLIMYYSLSFGYTRKGDFAPFDSFDVAEWIDEIGMDDTVIVDFFTAFRQSLTKDVPKDKEEGKKKVTKK
jgi:hypothetical protein